MADLVEVVDYDRGWPARFAALGAAMRSALGDVAVRIDHIGSTSVPGLAAKPVIDIQISVRSFEPLEAFKAPLERLGLVHRAGLFRDYLRVHPAAAAEFAEAKRRCAERFRDEREKYVAAKEPYVWDVVRQADTWAQSIGWRPGPSDA
ncbi:GrpB family protein [Nonomuraea sp. NBC_00507]|uniref:GrpB family protein n=1 Tax=Nonomuraea sp. NBC_00507 TaxID=2976002 RepID=UPI002E1768AF